MYDDDENETDNLADSTIVIGSGSVEYSIKDAATPLEELIANLQEALDDGMTHVVLASGNYRGAKWMRLESGYTFADGE